jgi:hypothetical protein
MVESPDQAIKKEQAIRTRHGERKYRFLLFYNKEHVRRKDYSRASLGGLAG